MSEYHQQREKQVRELMEKYDKSTKEVLIGLQNYIPDFTVLILKTLILSFQSTLNKFFKDQSIQDSIFNILNLMTSKYIRDRPETKPFEIIKQASQFLPTLIQCSNSDNNNLFQCLISIYIYDPSALFTLVKTQPDLFINLINAAATKNKLANKLLFYCFANPDQTQEAFNKLYSYFKTNIRKFSVGNAIDFMISYPDLRKEIPENEIEHWLLDHKEYTISDLDNVNTFYPAMWESPLFCTLIKTTKGDDNLELMKWIHKSCRVNFDLIPNKVIPKNSALDLIISITQPSEINQFETENERATFLFIRLFALSFCDPKDLSPASHELLINFMYDKNIIVSSAAIQMVFCWIKMRNYQGTPEMMYRIAEIAMNPENKDNTVYLHLCHALITAFAEFLPQAATIVSHENCLRFISSDKKIMSELKSVKTGSNVFFHFLELVQHLDDTKIVDITESLRIVGVITDYLSLT